MTKFFKLGKIMRYIFLVILAFLLINCTSYDFSQRIVQQGNLLTCKKISRLRMGMSKDNIAILMGSALLSPTFSRDRWDYAYTTRKGSNSLNMKHVSLYFSNNSLIKIDTNIICE